MKRSNLSIDAIADWHNLATAFYRAAKTAGDRRPVERYRARLEGELSRLRQGLMDGDYPVGRQRCFRIYDPKPRDIHAPVFAERVLHHALMALVGPILDRALVDDTFACRKGKGSHAAVRRCQAHLRRAPYYVQIDIQSYFSIIDHAVLLDLLARKFKDPNLLDLLGRIIAAYETAPGKGLPIGALTSQHFANYYLAGLDRALLNHPQVHGMVRYMDDVIWFCDCGVQARAQRRWVDEYLETELRLTRKPASKGGPSKRGTLFCGYRVLPGRILLSRRKKHRYQARRQYWEQACLRGEITAAELQRNIASVIGMTQLADAGGWRRVQLRRRPVAQALDWR